MELANKYRTLLTKRGVNTPIRLAHFFAQIDHESRLKPIEESMNYSVQGLLATFSRKRISECDANEFGRKPGKPANQESIANTVYGGEWGEINLGNIKHDDGWRFRGRGFIQVTGRGNYTRLSKDTGIDYVNSPDLLLTEADSMISALWFWNRHKLNYYADRDQILPITKIINGGTNGLTDRIKLLNHYKKKFNV